MRDWAHPYLIAVKSVCLEANGDPKPQGDLGPAPRLPLSVDPVIVNNSVNQPPPGPPSAGVRPYSTAGGRVLGGTPPAPLLVLARFRAHYQLTKNKSLRVTPLWHNDTHSRVTVTFGARRAPELKGCGPVLDRCFSLFSLQEAVWLDTSVPPVRAGRRWPS